uniref:RING-type domain-containing protein n=1 Tax=Callorhinchus milii TaxID=7868 RepID=A0A4W3GNW2_CALMI
MIGFVSSVTGIRLHSHTETETSFNQEVLRYKMASGLQAEIWTEEIICPVCLDFFTDPVSLGCGHNFCRSCVTRSWEKQEINCCAVCQETFPEKNLTASWALKGNSYRSRSQTERKDFSTEGEISVFMSQCLWLLCVHGVMSQSLWLLCVHGVMSQCLWLLCVCDVMSQGLCLLCVHVVMSQCLWLLCVHGVISQGL